MRNNFLQTILALPFNLRQKRLLAQRAPMSEDDFIAEIQKKGGDREAAALIRNHVLDWVYVLGFTPYPDDKLGYVFGIAEEELDEDLILMIFEKINITPPKRIFSSDAIDTPLQIAQFVKKVRDNEQSSV